MLEGKWETLWHVVLVMFSLGYLKGVFLVHVNPSGCAFIAVWLLLLGQVTQIAVWWHLDHHILCVQMRMHACLWKVLT